MASFQNQAQVQTQVCGPQNVQGSIFVGNVNRTIVYEDSARRRGRTILDAEATVSTNLDDEILSTLSFPQMLQQRANIQKPHKNTCQWILSLPEYRSWASQPSGLLWIKGKPGAGKSTIMYFLHDLWTQHTVTGIHLDFFFNARGVELQRTPLGMFRSLLIQLFIQDSDVRYLVRKIYEEKCRAFGLQARRLWDWQTPELKSLLHNCLLTSARNQQVNVFIDALDEAGKHAARDIAEYFHDILDGLASVNGAARICMSNRHYPGPPMTARGAEICVESHNANDIKSFVHDFLNLKRLSEDDLPDIKKWYELIDDSIRRANGIFHWARLVAPMLYQYLNDGDSLADARQHIERVPEELGYLYEYILHFVIDGRHRKQSFRLFQLVCLAARPLSLSEVQCALTVSTGPSIGTQNGAPTDCVVFRKDNLMGRRLKALSGGLVEIVTDQRHADEATVGFGGRFGHQAETAWRIVNNAGTEIEIKKESCSESTSVMVVQVIHQSVTDFILRNGLAILSAPNDGPANSIPISIDIVSSGQAAMFWTCANYLNSEDIQVSDVPVSASERRKRHRLRKQRQIAARHPLALYATTNILRHARLANDRHDHECNPEHKEDLRARMQALGAILDKWTFIMSLFFHPEIERAEGWSLLHMAASANSKAMLDYLTSASSLINPVGRRGHAPLHIAAYHGHSEAVKILIRRGADANLKTYDGETSLALAAQNGHLDVAKWLVYRDSVSKNTEIDLGTSLYDATKGKFHAVARLLVDAGADVNVSHLGETALGAACGTGSPKMVRLLLDAGARVNNLADSRHIHAFHTACNSGHLEVVKLMIEAGADIHVRGGRHGTALQAAASSCEYESGNPLLVVKFLLHLRLDVNVRSGEYGSALQAACRLGDKALPIVEELIAAEADVNVQGGLYGSPLEAAVHAEDSVELTRYLLKIGADVNRWAPPRDNRLLKSHDMLQQPLDTTITITRLLLDAGASINPQEGYLNHVLQHATKYQETTIFNVFIEHGAKMEDLLHLDFHS